MAICLSAAWHVRKISYRSARRFVSMFSTHRISATMIAVMVLAAQCAGAIARPPDPGAISVGEVAVNVPGNAKIGTVRSGILCTPTGSLSWYQVAMPTEKAMKDKIGTALRAGGRTVSADAPGTLSLSIDAASIRVCRAWMGVGNAPKGKGVLTLTWRERATPDSAERMTTVKRGLLFDKRDPRADPAVILDTIALAALDYAGTAHAAK
jgi:hypothetical protein